MKKLVVFLVMAGFVVFGTMNANASITLYDNQAAWEAAVGSFATEPFNASGLQSYTGVVTSAGAIGPARGVLSGSVWTDRVTVAGGESTTFSYKPGSFYGLGAVFDTSPSGEGQGLAFNVTLAGGGTAYIGELYMVDGVFRGFTSTDPIVSMTITAGTQVGSAETFDMGNLEFGKTTSAVPEPATMLLLGLGLAGVAVARKRFQK